VFSQRSSQGLTSLNHESTSRLDRIPSRSHIDYLDMRRATGEVGRGDAVVRISARWAEAR
jgi:hypothetical protein